jgi:tetratricopeptide (TPR) repeat protein
MGDPEGALAAFRTSQGIQERLGDRTALAITLGNIGSVLHGEGRLREAQDYLERSAGLQEALGETQACAITLNVQGTVQKKLGNLPAALVTYTRMRDLMLEAGDQARAALALYNMAILHEDRGEFRAALGLLEEVVRIDERLGLPDLRQDREALERVRRRLTAMGSGGESPSGRP